MGCLPLVPGGYLTLVWWVSASGHGGPASGLGGVSLWSGRVPLQTRSRPPPPGRHPLRRHPPAKCMLGYTTPPSACGIHTSPVDRQTAVKTLPLQTLFVSGNNLFTFTIQVYCLVFDDTYSLLEFLNNNGCGNRDGITPGVILAGSRCEILSWILLSVGTVDIINFI